MILNFDNINILEREESSFRSSFDDESQSKSDKQIIEEIGGIKLQQDTEKSLMFRNPRQDRHMSIINAYHD